jgi:NADP-dependent 3-hydroxy acid dehydrogenase YdfG
MTSWAPRTALVTGASSGIGRGVAIALASKGVRVIAAARRINALDRLASESSGSIAALELDVTDDAQLRALPEMLRALNADVDLLVNNAGYAAASPVEDAPLDEVRRQFDVNLVGLIGVTQAVLPAMRANRSGRIVNISSVAGVVSLPFLGVYCASKFAVEGLSDAMRLELKPFGIDVCIAQPAAIASEFAHVTHDQARAPSDAYARWYRPDALRDASEANAAPVDVAIDAVVKLCLSPKPKTRIAFPSRGLRMIAMQRLLPTRTFDAILAKRFHLTGG